MPQVASRTKQQLWWLFQCDLWFYIEQQSPRRPCDIHPRTRYPPGTRYTPRTDQEPPRTRYTPSQCMLGYGQQAGGTHSTGMHSCLWNFLVIFWTENTESTWKPKFSSITITKLFTDQSELCGIYSLNMLKLKYDNIQSTKIFNI